MTKTIKKIMIFIMIIISFLYSIQTIQNQDLYGTLIRLSIIPVIFIPSITTKIFKIDISEYSQIIYLIFVFLAHFLGSILNLYQKISWYDTFTHFLSGIVFSFFILEIFIKIQKFKRQDLWFSVLFILAMSCMIACCWEIFEFTCDQLFDRDAQNVLTTGVTDTMKDMIVALLGSSLFCLCFAFEYINDKKLFIQHFIDQIV